MAEQKILPDWAQNLRQKYLAGEASVFVVHGNIFDQQLAGEELVGLQKFLVEELLRDNKEEIFEMNLSGIKVVVGSPNATKAIQGMSGKTIVETLDVLEGRMNSDKSTALIIPYADTLFPAAQTSMLSSDERIAFTTLHRWSISPDITRRDNVIILLVESLSEINQSLLASPKVSAIKVPLPELEAREKVIRKMATHIDEDQVALLAKHTAGLRLVQIASIVATPPGSTMTDEARKALISKLLEGQPDAEERANKLAAITAGMTAEDIRKMINPAYVEEKKTSPLDEVLSVLMKRKKEAIEKECFGLVEFLNPKVGFEAVGGQEAVKAELMEIADVMKSGDTSLAPMGILAVGPMGAGKTFLIKAFLKESGLPGMVLKNFRSKWVGSTESNLETVLATAKAMGPCALIIDESDRSFGNSSGEDSDGGTSSRVIARLKEFMSDTDNRGQVLFILMTNRPDKLDVDIKRPGRLDRKIPFFYPALEEEKKSIITAVLKRIGVKHTIDVNALDIGAYDGSKDYVRPVGVDPVREFPVWYSAADFEAVVMLAAENARRAKEVLDAGFLKDAFNEFIRPQDSNMIRLMILLAVQESSRRSMLPWEFQNKPIEEIKRLIETLKRIAF